MMLLLWILRRLVRRKYEVSIVIGLVHSFHDQHILVTKQLFSSKDAPN